MNPALLACLRNKPIARVIDDAAEWWSVWQRLDGRAADAAGFAPEVPHANVQLDGARVDADVLLPGDGYDV